MADSIIKAVLGAEDSNSYFTMQQIEDSINVILGDNSSFADKTDIEKERLLIIATNDIEIILSKYFTRFYNGQYNGYYQNLTYPFSNCVYIQGNVELAENDYIIDTNLSKNYRSNYLINGSISIINDDFLYISDITDYDQNLNIIEFTEIDIIPENGDLYTLIPKTPNWLLNAFIEQLLYIIQNNTNNGYAEKYNSGLSSIGGNQANSESFHEVDEFSHLSIKTKNILKSIINNPIIKLGIIK